MITLLTPEAPRSYTIDQIALTNDIGQRIATFVENAGLYVKAQRAIAARDEFLSIASHELRTPVTSLSLQIQTLGRSMRGQAREPLSPAGMVHQIEQAEAQVARMSGLIAALFDVSRVTSGQLVLDRGDVDLCQVVRDVVARFRGPCAEEGSLLEVENGDEPIVGRWDSLRLEQVASNLLANALKYGAGKPIRVSVSSDGKRAILVVKDQGIGIAPESQRRIFQRFERDVSAVSYGGLGLGLFIAKNIVDAHRGAIDVRSALGHGAEFQVTLPLGDLD
jgi:signal transduction histidine kinase